MLETDRLILKPITLDDTQQMLKLHSDPEVQKYTCEPCINSEAVMVKGIKARELNFTKTGLCRFGVFIKGDDKLIGWSGLAYLEEFDKIDIGYRFLTSHWGKGYATESCRAVLRYGFETMNLDEIIAIALQENKASIHVMEKIGMRFDKIAPYDDQIRDAVWYSITKEQYNNTLVKV